MGFPRVVILIAVLTLVGAGCSTVSKRIHEHEALFNTYTPEQQAQIQNGHVDRGFTEEMVYMAMGEPSVKEPATRNGRAVTVWKYRKSVPSAQFANPNPTLTTPYGYPSISTGPAQPMPMRYETPYFKVVFENGKVIDSDEEGLPPSPEDLKMPQPAYH
jgi:hypothetical protein